MGPTGEDQVYTLESMLLLSILRNIGIVEITSAATKSKGDRRWLYYQQSSVKATQFIAWRRQECKICMKEIPHHFQTDQPKIMNDNSDIYIYSSFKYKERFDKFCLLSWTTYRDTEDAFAIATKKSTLLELLSQKNRFSFTLSSSRYCQQTTKEVPCNNRLGLRAEVSSTNQWREED
jgi:hypothetical protein